MGATQSARNITLVDDEKAGVIKLSENLAHRLRGQIEDSQASSGDSPSPPRPAPASPPHPPPTAAPVRPPSPPRSRAPSPPRDENRSGGSVAADAWTSVYADEARRALLRLQEEQDEALAAVEQTWMRKMEDREKQFAEASQLTVSELQQTASEVEATFVQGAITPVCRDSEEAVLACYKQYPGQTLRCADTVKQFTRCVDFTRLKSVMEDGVRKTG